MGNQQSAASSPEGPAHLDAFGFEESGCPIPRTRFVGTDDAPPAPPEGAAGDTPPEAAEAAEVAEAAEAAAEAAEAAEAALLLDLPAAAIAEPYYHDMMMAGV